MSAYTEGASFGSRIVQSGFDEFQKQREFQERLAARRQATQLRVEDNRLKDFEAQAKDAREQGELSIKQQEGAARVGEQAARSRYYDAEADWYARGRPGSGPRAGVDRKLTPNADIAQSNKEVKESLEHFRFLSSDSSTDPGDVKLAQAAWQKKVAERDVRVRRAREAAAGISTPAGGPHGAPTQGLPVSDLLDRYGIPGAP